MKLNLGEVKESLIRRKVITSSGCWEFPNTTAKRATIGRSTQGKRRTYNAAVIADEIWHGAPPPGLPYVLHSCDNPRCFNPDHVSRGTPSRNATEMIQRGRGRMQFTSDRMRGEKHVGNVLKEVEVLAIKVRLEAAERGEMARIAREYGVTIQAIHRIKTGENWGWLKCA